MQRARQEKVLEDLRERIRRLEGKPARASGGVESGWSALDALVPGGFPRGSIAELSGAAGSGKTALAIAVTARAIGERGLAAWIDGRAELYAPAVRAAGVELDRLLIVRPGNVPVAPSGVPPTRGLQPRAQQALWAAEAVLGSGAFAAVVVDVPLAGGSRRAADNWGGGASVEAMLRRLVAAAEKGGAICLWLSEPGACAPPARLRVEVSRGPDGVRARPARRGASDGVAGKVAWHAA